MKGYNNNGREVDINWWMTQIRAGEEYRRINANQSQWPTYRKMYRGHFREDLYPKNMFFIMARSIVPRLYFRNPKISIIAKKPGPDHQALAKVMERVDNSLIDSMDLKTQMKLMVNKSFFTSASVLKLLFSSQYMPTPQDGNNTIPITKTGFRPEYRQGIVQNMPFLKNIGLENFILATDIEDFDQSYFQAHRIIRFWDDLINDQRFPNFKAKAKRNTRNHGISPNDPIFAQSTEINPRDLVELFEIRDRRNRKVILLAPNNLSEPLLFLDDELQTSYSSPFYLFTPNIDDEHPYGVSDSSILFPLQQQLNDIKTKIHQHARLSIIKFLSKQGAIPEPEVSKLMSEDIGALVQLGTRKNIEVIEAHHIPDSLLKQEQNLMEDIREVMGFSRNSFAQFQSTSHGPTATEVNAVKGAAELRIDERRDMLSDILTHIFRDCHLVIFRHWTDEQVVKVVGKNSLPVWVRFTGDMLKEGEYEIKIEPDISVTETSEVREARANRLYLTLKDEPTIDRAALARHLLHETSGVALDDIMRSDIATDGNTVSLNEFVAGEQTQQGTIPPNLRVA